MGGEHFEESAAGEGEREKASARHSESAEDCSARGLLGGVGGRGGPQGRAGADEQADGERRPVKTGEPGEAGPPFDPAHFGEPESPRGQGIGEQDEKGGPHVVFIVKRRRWSED